MLRPVTSRAVAGLCATTCILALVLTTLVRHGHGPLLNSIMGRVISEQLRPARYVVYTTHNGTLNSVRGVDQGSAPTAVLANLLAAERSTKQSDHNDHGTTSRAPASPDCAPFNCSCQGASDTYNLSPHHWGETMVNDPVRKFWINNKCSTRLCNAVEFTPAQAKACRVTRNLSTINCTGPSLQCNKVASECNRRLVVRAAAVGPCAQGEGSAIPHKLWFTSVRETLPYIFAYNIQATIDLYRSAWGNESAPAKVLTDEDCIQFIAAHEPQLVLHFRAERHGMYKADVCRVAALYAEGGYYFDVDIGAVHAVVPNASHTLVTSTCASKECIFQAFLAATPRHPTMRKALDDLLAVYEDRLKVPWPGNWIGTFAMYTTIKRWRDENPVEAAREMLLLHEVGSHKVNKNEAISALSSAQVPHKGNARGACGYVVIHPDDRSSVYFVSRVGGTASCGQTWQC